MLELHPPHTHARSLRRGTLDHLISLDSSNQTLHSLNSLDWVSCVGVCVSNFAKVVIIIIALHPFPSNFSGSCIISSMAKSAIRDE